VHDADSIGQRSSNLLGLIVIVAVTIAAFAVGSTALFTGDLLWFIPTFNETPSAIVVHCAGQTTTQDAGSTAFAGLVEAIKADLSASKRLPDVGLSPGTQEEYWNRDLVLEVIFPKVVRVHASFRYGEFDTLIYPISGSHSPEGIVFGRRRNVTLTGLDIRDDNTESRTALALREMGYAWEGARGCTGP